MFSKQKSLILGFAFVLAAGSFFACNKVEQLRPTTSTEKLALQSASDERTLLEKGAWKDGGNGVAIVYAEDLITELKATELTPRTINFLKEIGCKIDQTKEGLSYKRSEIFSHISFRGKETIPQPDGFHCVTTNTCSAFHTNPKNVCYGLALSVSCDY
jgi:hypothetical protein